MIQQEFGYHGFLAIYALSLWKYKICVYCLLFGAQYLFIEINLTKHRQISLYKGADVQHDVTSDIYWIILSGEGNNTGMM